jgi:tripartite-type tricarboxylate transporter receptor subunit TctC
MYTQFGPGTPGDVLARVVAAAMSPIMGQPILVDSRPGGGGVLVAGMTARAEPDGYTVAMLTATVPVVGALLSKTPLPFDPVKDLAPVASIVESASLVVVNASLGIDSLGGLIEYAKRNPGKISYGTTGVGSSHHLNGEQLSMLTGTSMVHIPYKTSPVADAASGVLPMAITIAPQAVPLLKAGKIRALGVTTSRRFHVLPDVPLVSEVVPAFEPMPSWTGIYGPANLPEAVLRRLHADATAALNQPEVQAKIQQIGFYIVLSSSPEDFAARSKRGVELTARIVKAAKIEPQ